MSARDHALDQTIARSSSRSSSDRHGETSATILQLTPNSAKQVAEELDRGDVVGRYVIISKLGAGGMGIVYAAYDPELDRKVALKLVRATSRRRDANADDEQRTRLLREAQALAKLNHPNVVSVHDVGTLDGRVWIAMEYVDGQTLEDWSRAGPQPWREVARVMRCAGEGLAAAHDAGLLHRDFKPQNVMLGRDGRVRVMDFGLARSRRADDELDDDSNLEETIERGREDPLESRDSAFSRDVTRAGALMGTPAYMSPEQFRGADVTAASDQFAFAVSLWELVYGERPFRGRTLMQLALSVNAPPRAPRRANAAPRWLRRVCARALSPDPRARYESMQALLKALALGQRRRRARRRLIALGAAGLMAAGVVGQQRYAESRARAACVESGREFERAWTTRARDEVHAAILGTKLSYAGATADRVLPWLDTYALEVSAARTSACQAATVDEVWDQELYARASWCLDERALEFDALTTSLTRGEVSAIQEAISNASGLPHVAPCRDEATLRRLGPPPQDKLTEARSIRAALSRADALASAGEYSGGLQLAEDALERARSLGWAPLVAAAQLHVGTLRDTAGDPERAFVELEAAYAAAVRADARDLAAEAAVNLSYTASNGGGHHEAGEVWAELGALALEQLEIPEDAPLWHSLRSGMGSRLFATGEYAKALKLFERNAELRESALGAHHPRTAKALYNVATIKTALGEYDEARALFERSLDTKRQAFGETHPDVASSLNSLAAIELRTKSYEQARALHERALAIQEPALGEDHPDTLVTLNNLAVVYDYLGDKAEATRLYEQVLASRERALGPTNPLIASSLNNLALAMIDTGKFEEAIELNERALAIQEETFGPEHPDVAYSLDGLSGAYTALERYDEAEAALERALAVRERVLGPEHHEYANTLCNIAELYTAQGRAAEAVKTYERALEIIGAALGEDSLEAASYQYALAEVHYGEARPAEARALAERALATFERDGGAPLEIAAARFLLARALDRLGVEAARAHELAQQARGTYREFDHARDRLALAETWLKEHPAPSE